MKKTGAQILCESLLKEGVDVIFGLSGGTVIPMYDAFSEYPQIHRVLVRHEQAAAHAAAGYSRTRQKVGVCVATSGPGATNLVTGITDAYLDSTPIVAITGQVARSFIGKDAFQETDITGITLPVVKHSYLVRHASDIARVVKEAFHIAATGKPGPVLIDIPKDVQLEEAEYSYPESVDLPGYKPDVRTDPVQVARVAELLNRSERPVVISGRGVIVSGAHEELKTLAETLQAPVVHTLMGLGSFPPQHPLNMGLFGMHGSVYANRAVQDADLILAVGTRLGDRATMKAEEFAPNAILVHVDIDPAEINKNVIAFTSLVGDAKNALGQLNPLMEKVDRAGWLAKVTSWRAANPMEEYTGSAKLSTRRVIREIYQATDDHSIVVTGVGQHQMFAAQEFAATRANCFISSGGLGTMGFELPAAMGAQIACPDASVWVMAGEGGFQMTMQELSTIIQEGLPIKIAVLNNGYLGMVRQWQDMFMAHNLVDVAIHSPNFVKLADAYGISAEKVETPEQVGPAIQRAKNHAGPYLIEFTVDPEENVYPMVAPGQSLSCMIDAPKKVLAGKV
ncbi:MAG: biosynthetic-type acetolactate synthase large subunit [Dehalococcoidia bacterium]|nr:biosynthetic-type acetolactate synthase large subunit [Dehalococcoidia bacterium]